MENKYILTIDLGGMSAKCAIFNENGTIVHQFSVETKIGEILEHIYKVVKTELQKWGIMLSAIKAIGFGCPGLIDMQNGIVLKAVNLKWLDYPVRSMLISLFKTEIIFVLNDCKAATYGEWHHVYHGEVESLIMYTIGTGIGGSVIINNSLVNGASGMASELGHGGGLQDELPCTCQAQGCVERLSSASGLQLLLNKAREVKNSSLAKLYLKNGKHDLTIKDVAELFINCDEQVWDVFRHGLTPLAKHIAVMIDVLSPNIIVIGGGISNLGAPLIELISTETARYSLPEMFKSTTITTARLKNEAGTFGLYYYVINNIKKCCK